MQRGKSGIQKRPPNGAAKTREVRIPIKKKTAENLIRMNEQVAQKKAEYQDAVTQMYNHALPLLTERGLEKGQVVGVTPEAPYELILQVPK